MSELLGSVDLLNQPRALRSNPRQLGLRSGLGSVAHSSAIILPILTYASPVWFTGQEALLCELRTAQNDSCLPHRQCLPHHPCRPPPPPPSCSHHAHRSLPQNQTTHQKRLPPTPSPPSQLSAYRKSTRTPGRSQVRFDPSPHPPSPQKIHL